MRQRTLFLRTLSIALGFGLTFWLVDSLAYMFYFSRNLHRMIFEPPESLLDAVLFNISAHTFFVRLSFLIACLIGGWLAAHYMNRQRQSEKRLRHVVENMPVMMDAFDENDRLVAWNRECERVTGYSDEEIVGVPRPLEVLYPDADYRERLIADVTRLGGDFRDGEWTLTCKDGTQKTVSWSNISARFPIPGWHMWAIGVDVTEQRRNQARIAHVNSVLNAIRNVNQLIVREKNPQTLIDQSCRLLTETRDYQHAWIVLLDRNGAVISTASAESDCHADEIDRHLLQDEALPCISQALSRPGPICIHKTHRQCPDCPLNHLYQTSGAMSMRLEHDGIIYGVVSVALSLPFLHDDEEQALFEEVAGDISLALHGIRMEERRKDAENALRESEEKFRLLFENAHVLVSVYNRDGVCVLMNNNVAAHFGGTPGDFIGKAFHELHPSQGERYTERIRKAIDVPGEYRYEDCVAFPQGERWLLSTVHPVRDAQGTIYAAQIISHDITERKRAEEKLHEYSETLETMVEARTHELQKTQEQLLQHEKLAVLGKLAGSVAHELRHPLGVLSNAAYFLTMSLSEADDTTREYLEMIVEEVRKSDKIISDLLDFSRNQLPEKRLKTPVSLTTLVTETLAEHPPPAGVDIVRKLESGLPPVLIDPQQIKQVIANLLLNAYQAMPEGGTLTVGSKRSAVRSEPSNRDSSLSTAPCALLTVQDTGCGITGEDLDRVFDPLFTTKAKGIGLGLAICKYLAEANGGRIAVESHPGQGSAFIVSLQLEEGETAVTFSEKS